jgi:hypothetical protein
LSVLIIGISGCMLLSFVSRPFHIPQDVASL